MLIITTTYSGATVVGDQIQVVNSVGPSGENVVEPSGGNAAGPSGENFVELLPLENVAGPPGGSFEN